MNDCTHKVCTKETEKEGKLEVKHNKVWAATVGEALVCEREPKNTSDRYAVAVKNKETITEHLPRKLSRLCSLFLRRESMSVEGEHVEWRMQSIIRIVIIRCRKNFVRLV